MQCSAADRHKEPDQLQFAADFITVYFSTAIGIHRELKWEINPVMH
jgi:hypothetical protein